MVEPIAFPNVKQTPNCIQWLRLPRAWKTDAQKPTS